MPKVYNKHHGDAPADAVYIGRPSPWGNPFSIGVHGSRSDVVEEFREKALNDPDFIELVQKNLRGKDLICFCAPKACHGDILLEIANEETDEND